MQPQFFPWPEWLSHPHAPSTGGDMVEMLLQAPNQSQEESKGHTISASTLPTINSLKRVGAEPSADTGLILLEAASGALEMVTWPRTCVVCFHFQTLWAYVKFNQRICILATLHRPRAFGKLVGPSRLLQNVLNFCQLSLLLLRG